MNKYGTLTEFPLGIVRKARKLNIKDTRGTRNFGSLNTPISSVAKNGGNMNLYDKLPRNEQKIMNILSPKLAKVCKKVDVHLGALAIERPYLKKDISKFVKLSVLFGENMPLILTKETEVKWIRFF